MCTFKIIEKPSVYTTKDSFFFLSKNGHDWFLDLEPWRFKNEIFNDEYE